MSGQFNLMSDNNQYFSFTEYNYILKYQYVNYKVNQIQTESFK